MVTPVTGPDARAHRDTDGEVPGSPTASASPNSSQNLRLGAGTLSEV